MVTEIVESKHIMKDLIKIKINQDEVEVGAQNNQNSKNHTGGAEDEKNNYKFV